ncbi:MAG: hypothetical protein J5933_04695 [Clostridia bacterium]|nr:hypothetical protein [Clostridia bacterium]
MKLFRTILCLTVPALLIVCLIGCSGTSIYDLETIAVPDVTTAAQLVTGENGRLVTEGEGNDLSVLWSGSYAVGDITLTVTPGTEEGKLFLAFKDEDGLYELTFDPAEGDDSKIISEDGSFSASLTEDGIEVTAPEEKQSLGGLYKKQ